MKNLYVFFVIALATIVSASHIHGADLKDGFMDYAWGKDIAQYQQLQEIRTKGDVSYYSNPGQSYTIEDTIIDNVIYGFYQRKLFAVYIGINNLEKYDSIKRYLQSKYGLPGTKVYTEEYLTTYHWRYEDVTIKLKSHQIDTQMKLAFYYRPLSKELNKEQIDQFTETSFKFFPINKNEKPERIPFLEF